MKNPVSIIVISLYFAWIVSSSNIGTFLQLTDIHFDIDYSEGSYAECLRDVVGLPCCHRGELPLSLRLAGKYGDYNCDTPEILINETLRSIINLDPSPDFVIWTGDNPSHSDLTQSESINLNAIKRVTDLIYSYLPNTMIYPSYGNHDTWPVDQLANPPAYSWLREPVATYWSKWIKDDENTLKSGGFYAVSVAPGLRIISINTLYYDSNNLMLHGIEDPAKQYEWFEKELYNAKLVNVSVWIIAHIFPGDGEASDDYSLRYQKLCSEYADIIKGHFFGHSHKDQFTLIRGDHQRVSDVIYIAPSVTPQSIMNPSYRIYYYNKQTFEIVDYDQYYLDLTKANQLGKVDYKLNYKATQFFNISQEEFNTGSTWETITERFSSDEHFFETYIQTVYNGHAVEKPKCTGSCKREQLCHILYADNPSYKKCTNNQEKSLK